jgi:hypothetical protein
MEPKFKLGQTLETAKALSVLAQEDVCTALYKHERGDWGLTCAKDQATNENALKYDGQLMSVWKDRNGIDYWIITEWDRSVTTVLLPSDY